MSEEEEDKLPKLYANFAHVWCQVVNRDEFGRVRPLQCDLELREEFLVEVIEVGTARVALRVGRPIEGDRWRDMRAVPNGDLRRVVGRIARVDQTSGGDTDEETGSCCSADPPRRQPRARRRRSLSRRMSGEADDPRWMRQLF